MGFRKSYKYAHSDESQTFFPEPSQFGQARTGVFDRSPGYQENIQLFEFLTQGRCEIALWEALSGAINEVTFRTTLISDENPTCPVILEKPGTIDQPT